MEERRQLNRVEYATKGVIVICDTAEKIYADVKDISPLGMGVLIDKNSPELLNKDIIIVADCVVMFATVNRIESYNDEKDIIGIAGKTFTDEVLQYLFDRIG